MKGRLLLTGANGRTGRAVLRSLVQAKVPVRAFIREEAQASALEALGAHETVVGDLTDESALARAVDGVEQVLHIGPPMHADEFTITSSLVARAKAAGVDHFIYYSVMHPLARAIRHHRLKLDAEEHLIDSGLAYTILQPSRYMQHLVPIWRQVVEEGVHAMPFDTNRKFSVVDLQDLADAAAVVACDGRFRFGTYELAGPQALSQQDMAEIISGVISRPVTARAIPLSEMVDKARAAGANEDRIAQMGIMNAHYDAHGFQSNAEVLQLIIGRPATTFRSYVRRLAAKHDT